MTIRKRDMIDRYLDGESDVPDASRESVRTFDGTRCIVGYGWAVYLAELPDGRYALFGDGYASHGTNVGWAGYSGQTTQHLQELKGMLEHRGLPYVVVDARVRATPGRSNWGRGTAYPALSEIEDLPAFVDEHETEPADGGGYTMTL